MKKLKKYLIFGIPIIFLLFFIIDKPVQAASVSESGSIIINGVVRETISFFVKTQPAGINIPQNLSIFSGQMEILPTIIHTSSPDIQLIILTNNKNGYTIDIQDAGNKVNSGLYDAKARFIIGSADFNYNDTTDLSKHPGYGVQASSAQANIDPRYEQSGTRVGGYEITPQVLASYPAPANYHVITLVHKARASGATPAGNYNDIVTVIAFPNL